MQRIVFDYSGSADASPAIAWLGSTHGAEVITVTLDAGDRDGLEEVRRRALVAGAARAHVLDVRDELALDFVVPALRAGALDGHRPELERGLRQSLLARKLVEIAAIEQATAIAYLIPVAATDPSPLAAAIRMLNPAMAVVEVARERVLGGAERLPRAAGRPPLARSGRRPLDAESASVDLAFERGVPVAINGVPMPLSELTAALGTICGAPGLRVLGAARREVQKLTLAKDVDRFLRVVGRQYADLIDRGGWYSPLRRALDVLVDHVQERVTGVIRMQVRRGECRIVGLPARTAAAKSPLPRRQPRPVSMLVR